MAATVTRPNHNLALGWTLAAVLAPAAAVLGWYIGRALCFGVVLA